MGVVTGLITILLLLAGSTYGRHLKTADRLVNKTSGDRGLIFCGGSHHIPDVFGVVHQLRHIWNVDMNITVAHCGELNSEIVKFLKDKRVDSLDMCAGPTVLGMTRDFAAHRLRGFFCKTAALVLSPYRETLIADLDVVFFKNPLTLFDSPAYISTGAVYFRDKPYTGDCNGPTQVQIKKLFKNLTSSYESSPELYSSFSKSQDSAAGGSFYWRHEGDSNQPCYVNFQDSSLIAFDKARHSGTMQYLTELLPTFSIGYGDKEIYWIANTLANETFSFEPFLVATYGDCGVLMHYDPSDVANPANALPLYINAEYIIEKIGLFGINLEFFLPNPVLVNSTLEVKTWMFYRVEGGGKSCSCYLYGCRPIPNNTNSLLLRGQWERISRGFRTRKDSSTCVDLYKPNGWIISMAMENMISNGDCTHLGCYYVPIYINTSTFYQTSHDSFCNPVSMDAVPLSSVGERSRIAQLIPNKPDLTDLQPVKGSGRAIYMYFANDSSLHMIPSWDTFLRLKLDLSQVRGMSDAEISLFPIGDDVWKGLSV